MMTALMTFAQRLSSFASYRKTVLMNERELAVRGISRDALVRGYISGLGLR